MLGMSVISPVFSPAILLGIPMIDDQSQRISKSLNAVILTELADEEEIVESSDKKSVAL